MSTASQDFSRKFVYLGFIFFTLCLAFAISDPIPSETSSVPTLQTSQLVASASNKDDGLTPEAPPKPEVADEKKTELSEGGSSGKAALASEVGDMMKDPYHNFTISTSDRDEVPLVDNETDIIYDPHVNRSNKTHEEEEEAEGKSSVAPVGSSTEQASSTDSSTSESATKQSMLEVSVMVSLKEASTLMYSVPGTEAVETNDKERVETETGMEQKRASDPDEELTSPPVSALVSHETHDHSTNGKASSLSHTTEAAAILAGVLVLVALAGYLGLLLWRRVLEQRYGNREMLVNEDDDFKHFEL